MTATAHRLAQLPTDTRAAILASLSPAELEELAWNWEFWRQPHQVPPEPPWRVWALIAGRGSGKSWTGAQWVRSEIESGRRRSIALVAPDTPRRPKDNGRGRSVASLPAAHDAGL